MKYRHRIKYPVSAASALVLAAANTLVIAADEAASPEEGGYTPLILDTRSLPTSSHNGELRLGLGQANDDNFMFGQYNGLNEDGVNLIGDLRWQDFSSGDSYWRITLSEPGLDTREGQLIWGRSDKVKLTLGFDSQLQVRNNTGSTPFLGNAELQLPDNWVKGSRTSDWTALDESLQSFDRELEREEISAALELKLNDQWQLQAGVSYEDRQGTGDVGGGIYINGASADAVLLPAPVDYSTTEFDLGLSYSGEQLHLQGQLDYSDFDNKIDVLTWENPYSAWRGVIGGLGMAPDNDQWRARLTGQYLFSPKIRFQFDGSYAIASQDQDYLDYSVNPDLNVSEPLPRSSLDGEVAIATFDSKLLVRHSSKLNMELFYRARERDYDTPRDGYRYILGDATDQPDQAFAVYNTAHDYLSQTAGGEISYRLPLRSRLTAGYAYEKVERKNAAVEETEEDRLTLAYRIQPRHDLTAKLELEYGDRSAGTYSWDQRYYALLDSELINATPDNQRYINHPELSQYQLSNRERTGGKLDVSYQPNHNWQLNLDVMWRDDDYDRTYTGLREADWRRGHLSATYAATSSLSATLYAGYDRYDSAQMGRAFRGGQEKNAFEIYPPLPQASDPDRDWELEAEDTSLTVGASLHWQAADNLELEADYAFVDTEGEQTIKGYGASDLDTGDLPTVETRLHHLTAAGTWHLREDLSMRLDYQYYRYRSDDWAWRGVEADTLDKVLTFGARNPDEQIHYIGVSAIYRWQ